MARKYVRDNRGRFASVGATGRGGRLKTASGKKRATQTMKASGGQRAGAIRGKLKRDPAAAGKIGKAKSAGKSYRTRAQAAARQKERSRMMLDQAGGYSRKIRAVSNKQGNLLTGRADRHVTGYKIGPATARDSLLSKSFNRARTRQMRTGSRIMKLNDQRNNLIASTPSARFSKRSNPEYRQLFKLQKSIQTQRSASDFYDTNPRVARSRSGRRRRG